jgi:outer membrane protein
MTLDFAKARETMVEQQVRPWDVLDARVLEVLSALPREAFVADAYRALAYADQALPIGHGEVMMKPVVEGRMLQSLDLQPDEEVLEIGTGSGFIAACLGRLARAVVSIERHADLADAARSRLQAQRLGGNVEIVGADAMAWQTTAASTRSASPGRSIPCRRISSAGCVRVDACSSSAAARRRWKRSCCAPTAAASRPNPCSKPNCPTSPAPRRCPNSSSDLLRTRGTPLKQGRRMSPRRLALALAFALLPATAAAEDLMQTYELARGGDPRFSEVESQSRATREGAVQARAAMLPQISGDASVRRSRSEGPATQNQFDPVTGEPVQFTGDIESEVTTRDMGLNLRQMVYDRANFTRLEAQRARSRAADYTVDAAGDDLITRTSAAYFNVLVAIETLAAAEAQQTALRKQLDFADKRLEVGLAPITDVHEARAQFDRRTRQRGGDAGRARRRLPGPGRDHRHPGARPARACPPTSSRNCRPPAAPTSGCHRAGEQSQHPLAGRAGECVRGRHQDRPRRPPAHGVPERQLRRQPHHRRPDLQQFRAAAGGDQPDRQPEPRAERRPRPVGADLLRRRGAVAGAPGGRAARREPDRLEQQRRAVVRNTHNAYQAVVSGMSEVEARRLALVSAQSAYDASQVGLEVGTRTVIDVLINQQTLFTRSASTRWPATTSCRTGCCSSRQAGTLDIEDLQEINRLLTVNAEAQLSSPPRAPGSRLFALIRLAGGSTGAIRRRVRASAPRPVPPARGRHRPSRAAPPHPPAATRAPRRRRSTSAPTCSAPAACMCRAISAKLCRCGPVTTGVPTAAGSSRLCPPIGCRLPPTKATSAQA